MFKGIAQQPLLKTTHLVKNMQIHKKFLRTLNKLASHKFLNICKAEVEKPQNLS